MFAKPRVVRARRTFLTNHVIIVAKFTSSHGIKHALVSTLTLPILDSKKAIN